MARKKIISLARDFWGNPDALWDLFYILPAKRIISSIRGGCTTNFLLSYTHQRSGERFNKTLNGTKCWRNRAIITSEAFSFPSRKSFHYTQALHFEGTQVLPWTMLDKTKQKFTSLTCKGKTKLSHQILLACYPKTAGLRGSRKISCFPPLTARVDQIFTWRKLA